MENSFVFRCLIFIGCDFFPQIIVIDHRLHRSITTKVYFSSIDLLKMGSREEVTSKKNVIKPDDPAYIKLAKSGGHASK